MIKKNNFKKSKGMITQSLGRSLPLEKGQGEACSREWDTRGFCGVSNILFPGLLAGGYFRVGGDRGGIL